MLKYFKPLIAAGNSIAKSISNSPLCGKKKTKKEIDSESSNSNRNEFDEDLSSNANNTNSPSDILNCLRRTCPLITYIYLQ